MEGETVAQKTSRLVGRNGLPSLRIPLLCYRCTQGDHSRLHDEMGCLMPVMLQPYDFICRCDQPGRMQWPTAD